MEQEVLEEVQGSAVLVATRLPAGLAVLPKRFSRPWSAPQGHREEKSPDFAQNSVCLSNSTLVSKAENPSMQQMTAGTARKGKQNSSTLPRLQTVTGKGGPARSTGSKCPVCQR